MSYKEKLNIVKTFIFDIDGVITNGDVLVLDSGEFYRTMNSRDGHALRFSSRMGYNIFVITGGHSEALKNQLLKSGVKKVIDKSINKLKDYQALKEEFGFKDEEVLYMGDDLPDYFVMKAVGVSTCPQDAAVEIKALADYQSPYKGGRHAVRDVIEQTLRVQGVWAKHFEEEHNF